MKKQKNTVLAYFEAHRKFFTRDAAKEVAMSRWFINFPNENLNGAQCISWSDETNVSNR